MDTLLQDLRFAIRTLRRSPGVTALAVLCMALGIGSVTTMYSSANAFTFRPLPQVRDPGRLAHVWEAPASAPDRMDGVSAGALRDLQAERGVFSDVAAVAYWEANIAGTDVAERVRAARVSATALRAFGRTPLLGRDFLPADDEAGAARVVLLGHGLWQRRFGGEPALVGRTVRINGEGYEVVGILPEDFVFPAGVQLWVPLALGPDAAVSRRDRRYDVLARLAPGVDQARAASAVAAMGARLAAAHPEASDGWVMRAQPAERTFGAGPRPFMIVLLGAVGFVLLIACATVANLLLVRATARRREIAVRVALGASRGRIVRQLLTESVVIALAGGALGVVVALWGLSATAASVPVEIRTFIPGFGAMRLDARALGFTALVAVLSGAVFGLAPALAAARADVQQSLKDAGRSEAGGGGARRLRGALVVTEVALALVLLSGATLMVATLRRLLLDDPGFRTSGVLTLGVTLPAADYPRDSAVTAFWDELERRLTELPGVEAVGATTVLPMSWAEQRTGVEVEGRPPRRPEEAPRVGLRMVSAGYLPGLGVPVIRGRHLAEDDRSGSRDVAVLSEAAARRLWPGEEALGKRLRVRGQRWVEIVGVVGNVRGNPLVTDDPLPVLYLPRRQWAARSLLLVVRTAGEPTALAPAIQREIAALDSRLAAGDVATMPRVVATAVSPQSATAQTLAAAALIALLMAAVGTYGVMAYAVAQRTQEIGVRVALGATGADIARLVLGQALVLLGAGLGLGIVGALLTGRAMRAILYETNAADPAVIGGVALLLGAIGLLASWVPTRRALRVHPMEALRYE